MINDTSESPQKKFVIRVLFDNSMSTVNLDIAYIFFYIHTIKQIKLDTFKKQFMHGN